MEESRINRTANKILYITKREDLLIAENEKDKVIDTLFEEERQAFTQKIRSALEEEEGFFVETAKNFEENLKTLLESKFKSFPDEIEWVGKLQNSGPNLKDINIKELKSKGIEVVYTKNGIQLKEPKLKDKSKRKAEDKEDAETGGNDGNKNADADATTAGEVAAEDNNSAKVDVISTSDSGKVLRKRRKT